MATLSSALNYALAGLSVASSQSAILSRNVSSAGDENYARRSGEVSVLPSGLPVVARVTRSADKLLLDRLLSSGSNASGQQIIAEALNRISSLTGDPEDDMSIASSIGRLQQDLRSYESNPSSTVLARSVLESAKMVAARLNTASADIASVRSEADKGMAISAERVNNLLAQFKVLNDSVVRGQGTPDDLLESLDQRDSVLKLLSEEIGIRTVMRPNNDILIFAENGAVLFEGSPREVSFTATSNLQPGLDGAELRIDGVTVTGDGAPMVLSSGKIAAYAKLRDSLAPMVSLQIDQIASGLIRAFSEDGPVGSPTLPAVEGLFKATGTVPATSDMSEGIAGQIRINEMADPDQGGSLMMLRDGGFGGTAYVENVLGQTGYQLRIAELASLLDATQMFPDIGGLGGEMSLKTLSLQSISWIEATRQDAQSSLDIAQATALRASDSLGRVTGVNIDFEMATLMDLEKSYQASSKVLSVVDSMLAILLEAVG